MVWIDHVPMPWFLEADAHGALRTLLRFVILFSVLGIGFAALSVVGFTSKFYLGKQVWKFIGDVASRIPVLGAIYGTLDQLIRTLSSSGSKQFSRVVYLEFPRKDVWVVGFVTGPIHLKGFSEGYLNVFVPAVPNPTSGFHLIVREAEVRDSGLRVDEAFKMILSLGVAAPAAHTLAAQTTPTPSSGKV